VVQIWPGQTVTCLHTNSPGHIWTTLYNCYLEPLLSQSEILYTWYDCTFLRFSLKCCQSCSCLRNFLDLLKPCGLYRFRKHKTLDPVILIFCFSNNISSHTPTLSVNLSEVYVPLRFSNQSLLQGCFLLIKKLMEGRLKESDSKIKFQDMCHCLLLHTFSSIWFSSVGTASEHFLRLCCWRCLFQRVWKHRLGNVLSEITPVKRDSQEQMPEVYHCVENMCLFWV
jgi:hypothetical protein